MSSGRLLSVNKMLPIISLILVDNSILDVRVIVIVELYRVITIIGVTLVVEIRYIRYIVNCK